MSAPVWEYITGLHSFSEECVGIDLGAQSGGATPSSAAWPAANDALFVPLYLCQPVVVTRLYSVNGSTVSGNIDMGIYAEDGARIASIGSTAQSGSTALQFFNITDTPLAPGRYYLAVALDNTTGTLFRSNLTVVRNQTLGLAKMASAFALPATATFATVTSGFFPFVGAEIATVF